VEGIIASIPTAGAAPDFIGVGMRTDAVSAGAAPRAGAAGIAAAVVVATVEAGAAARMEAVGTVAVDMVLVVTAAMEVEVTAVEVMAGADMAAEVTVVATDIASA
jgi:hypothetical protein